MLFNVIENKIFFTKNRLEETLPEIFFVAGYDYQINNIDVTFKVRAFAFTDKANPNVSWGAEDSMWVADGLLFFECKSHTDAICLSSFLIKEYIKKQRETIMRFIPEDMILSDKLKALFERTKRFFDSKSDYEKYKLAYRRGLLLYGPPGSGKTAFVYYVISQFPDAIVSESFFDDEENLYFKNYKKIVYHNEIEDQLGNDWDRSRLLTKLEKVADNTLVLGTTNKPDKLDMAIYNRPGRFEEVVYIDYPKQSEILAFLKSRNCEDLKDFTKGLAFTHLNELIYRVKINEEDPEVVYKDLKNMNSKLLKACLDPIKEQSTGFGLKRED